ncbi:hypothetical protein [Klebsiella pneumoniae]
MTLWMKGWKQNGWITADKEAVKNVGSGNDSI